MSHDVTCMMRSHIILAAWCTPVVFRKSWLYSSAEDWGVKRQCFKLERIKWERACLALNHPVPGLTSTVGLDEQEGDALIFFWGVSLRMSEHPASFDDTNICNNFSKLSLYKTSHVFCCDTNNITKNGTKNQCRCPLCSHRKDLSLKYQ